MMAHESSEGARVNFGKPIYLFQLKTKALIRKLDRILIEFIDKCVFII